MAQIYMNNRTAKRVFLLLVLFALFSLFLLCVIFKMQVFEYDRYQEEVIEQISNPKTVAAGRGAIYDANGAALASNQTTWRVFISPSDIQNAVYSSAIERAAHRVRYGASYADSQKGQRQDVLIASGLSEILGVDYDLILEKTGKRGRNDETIKKNVNKETADKVMDFIDEYGLSRQVHLEATHKRYYTFGTMAAQTIGFAGEDGMGLYGLEYRYNEELSGTPGKYITAKDARGNTIAYNYESYVEPKNGYDMYTTLDARIQRELDAQVKATVEENKPTNRACGIAMNPKTGGIYAISVQPEFDLNDPYTLDAVSQSILDASGFSEGSSEYKTLMKELREALWNNKAVTEIYEPGSTFKPITSAMALEENLIDLAHETFTCTGSLLVGGWTIHCHKRTGHGVVSFARGLQQSCNPVLMTIAARVGVDRFCDYFEAFGYLDKTGIDLPGEGTTVFFSRNSMGDSDLAVASFGQQFKVSPIAHLTALCAIANGGYLVTPHLLDHFEDETGTVVYSFDDTSRRQIISTETAKTLTEILEAGVSGDGGAKNAYVKGYKVAAKTGTSEKRDITDEELRISSTIAYAPADDPQIAVLIMVDEPRGDSVYGSVVAAPYVSKFLENVLPYMGIEPAYTDAELATLAYTVPRFTGMTPGDAKAQLSAAGIACETVGNGESVTAQMPKKGSVISKENGKVILYTAGNDPESKTVTVPNVVSLTVSEANAKIVNAGLNIEIKGAQNYDKGSGALVTSQSAAAGEKLPYGSVLTVEVMHLDVSD